MKAIAIITEKNETHAAQWQYDKVMSAIAYDLDLTIVFVNQGITQLLHNPAWKCLNIFGIDSIYIISENLKSNEKFVVKTNQINVQELRQKILESQLIL